MSWFPMQFLCWICNYAIWILNQCWQKYIFLMKTKKCTIHGIFMHIPTPDMCRSTHESYAMWTLPYSLWIVNQSVYVRSIFTNTFFFLQYYNKILFFQTGISFNWTALIGPHTNGFFLWLYTAFESCIKL